MTRLQNIVTAVVAITLIISVNADDVQLLSERMDDGGTVIANVADGEKKLSQSWAKIRDFLWQHWHLRVGGRIVVVGTTTEGSPYKTIYIIKRDQADKWLIAVTAEGEYFDPIKETSEHWDRRFDAYTVTRVHKNKDSRPISVEARVAAKDYRLMLADSSGNIVAESL
jgi:hypothetical protein